MNKSSARQAAALDTPPEPSHDPGAGRWWARFRWLAELVHAGTLARLSPAARAVLVVYYAHANTDGAAWPATGTVARLAGVNRRTVRRARAELEAMALIEPEGPEAGGRASRRYQLSKDPDPGPQSPPWADRTAPPGRTVQPPELLQLNRNNRTAPKAPPPLLSPGATLFDALEARDLLAARGFTTPDAAQLAGRHHLAEITGALEAADTLKAAGRIRSSYRGAVVHQLANCYQAASRPQGATAGPGPRDITEAQRAAEDASLAAYEADRRRRVFAGLPADQVTRYRALVLEAMPEAARRFHHHLSPGHPVMAAAIVALHETGPLLFLEAPGQQRG